MATDRILLTSAALAQYKADFDGDGCFKVAGLFSEADMQKIETLFDYAIEHPGPDACPRTGEHKMVYIDHGLSHIWQTKVYWDVLFIPALGHLAATLFGSDDVWFIDEQLIWKRCGSKRTPWRQDSRYFPYNGVDQVQLWISLSPVERDNALEFVGGSHRWPIYGHIEGHETCLGEKLPMAIAPEAVILKGIEARRDQFDIKGWPVARGDVLAFHPSTIYGGAPDESNLSRRSLTLRMCGPRTVRTPAPAGMELGRGAYGLFGAILDLPLGVPISTLNEAVKIWPRSACSVLYSRFPSTHRLSS